MKECVDKGTIDMCYDVPRKRRTNKSLTGKKLIKVILTWIIELLLGNIDYQYLDWKLLHKQVMNSILLREEQGLDWLILLLLFICIYKFFCYKTLKSRFVRDVGNLAHYR